MAAEGVGQTRTGGVRHRDEVVDGLGIEYLAADPRPDHGGANALTSRVHGGRGTGGTRPYDEHVVGVALREVFLGSLGGVGVETLEDFGHVHAPGAPVLAVQVDGRHRGDSFGFYLIGVGATVNGGVVNIRVEDGHCVEVLHYRRAILAG